VTVFVYLVSPFVSHETNFMARVGLTYIHTATHLVGKPVPCWEDGQTGDGSLTLDVIASYVATGARRLGLMSGNRLLLSVTPRRYHRGLLTRCQLPDTDLARGPVMVLATHKYRVWPRSPGN
jgi:hypothetical protein